MNANEIKIGERIYHGIFGWCKAMHPATPSGSVLVDLEADEIEYYQMGIGYKTYQRSLNGLNILLTPISDLLPDDKNIPNFIHLKKMALNPKLKFNTSKNCFCNDNDECERILMSGKKCDDCEYKIAISKKL